MVKPTSSQKKYEYIRSHGFHIPGADGTHTCLMGQELDEYLNEAIWREKHPGAALTKEWEDGVST